MSSVKKIGGRLEIVPTKEKLGNLVAGTLADEATTIGQLQNGTMNLTVENLTVEGTLTSSAMTIDSTAPAITAKAGGGQDATLALSKNLNIVTTVATAGDSVTLPAASAGLRITIVNLGANNLAVFPYTSDSINDEAANASVTQDPETSVTYNCYTGVLWESDNESLDAFDKIYVGNGTVALPAVTFASDKDSGIYSIGANNIGVGVNGAKVLDIGTTGLAVTGLVSSTTTVSVGTSINVGTDQTFTKEVNHTISVTATTTAATVGGDLTINSGNGATSGNGGQLVLTSGSGGETGTGGALNLSSGAGGTASGNSGLVNIKSGNETGTDASGSVTVNSGTTASANSGDLTVRTGAVATLGNSGSATFGSGASSTSGNTGTVTLSSGIATAGASGTISVTTGAGTTSTGGITLTTGNASAGTAGNITLTPGTTSSATVSPIVIATSNTVVKPLNSASVATGAAITGKQLVDGYIAITGGTGNVNLPSTADITTAIGASPAGTVLEFTVNAVGMTATNTATLVVGANMSVPSAPAITGGATLTLTQDTQVIGVFKLVFITATTTKLFRIA